MGLAKSLHAKRVLAIIVAGAVVVGLASCTLAPQTEAPTAPTAAPTSNPEPQKTEEPEPDIGLVEDGTAEENLPYFDSVVAELTEEGNPGGRAITEGLTAAGFDKAAMELTQDRTPLGNRVDALQFSVHMGATCLIGQLDGQGYTGVAAPVLKNGGCLIGKTRTISW